MGTALEVAKQKLGGFGGMIGIGANVLFGGMAYSEAREAGHGTAYSVGRGALEIIGWQVAAPLMFAKDIPELLGGVPTMYDAARKQISETNRQYQANFGGMYQDTGLAANMRQAGFYSMQQSKSDIQSRLGRESKQYYRPNNQPWY